MTKTEVQLREDFPQDFAGNLVNAVRQAYDSNYSNFDPSIGHDAMTFGLMVYKSKVHYLSALAEDDERVTIVQKHPYFSAQVGRYRLSTYCAGHSNDVDVNTAFPLNRTRASAITTRNQAQLNLPFPSYDDLDDSACRNVILCDVGNPTEGALKVFLAIPIAKDKDGRITRWGTILPLWENEDITATTGDLDNGNLTPVEEVLPPTVTLKEGVEGDIKKIKEEK